MILSGMGIKGKMLSSRLTTLYLFADTCANSFHKEFLGARWCVIPILFSRSSNALGIEACASLDDI